MTMDPDSLEKVEITSADALWDWLDVHHAQDAGVWLVTWKASRRDRYVSRDEVLDALIAYGWIDGRRMKLDEARTMQLISPRRQQAWAQSYKDRAARLDAAGRMKAPGRAMVEKGKESGLWNAMAAVDALEEPADLIEELTARGAAPWWGEAAPSYRRNVLRWIARAKQAKTRARRIATVVDYAVQAKKVPNY